MLEPSCLSVLAYSTSVAIFVIGYFGFRFTRRTSKFCSIIFSSSWSSTLVVAGCDKQDSLMRRGVCNKLHGGRSQLFAFHNIDSQIFVENRDYCAYPTCIRRPVRRVPVRILP